MDILLSYVVPTIHVVLCLFLIAVVLLQTGKRADLAGAFGGGGSQTVFGTRGAATLLSKITTGAAIAFMLTSLGLSLMAGHTPGGTGGGSVLPDEPAASTAPAPSPSAAPVVPAPSSAPAPPASP